MNTLKTRRKKKKKSSRRSGDCVDLWEKWNASYADKNKEGVYEFI